MKDGTENRSTLYYRRTKIMKQVNSNLKLAAKVAGLTDTNFTLYSAQHTYGTTLKLSGVPTAVISQAMGHNSVIVTEVYLKQFDTSVIDDADKFLL